MNDLADKIIVVTGGEGLLGTAFVSCCRKAGAIALSADIKGGDIHMDITDELSVCACIESVVREHGHIDGWINNAYPHTHDWHSAFEDIPLASWQQNIDWHLGGYFLCCKAVLEQMKRQKRGALINMGSIYGSIAPDFSSYTGTNMTSPAAYHAIKGGILQLTRYLASYYGQHGVRVNTLSPGGVFNNQPHDFVQRYQSKTPLGRMAHPDDIAPAAVFLLSEEAKYITGHNLVVDGGLSIM